MDDRFPVAETLGELHRQAPFVDGIVHVTIEHAQVGRVASRHQRRGSLRVGADEGECFAQHRLALRVASRDHEQMRHARERNHLALSVARIAPEVRRGLARFDGFRRADR